MFQCILPHYFKGQFILFLIIFVFYSAQNRYGLYLVWGKLSTGGFLQTTPIAVTVFP